MEIVNLAPYPVPQAITYADTTFGKADVEDERMDQFLQIRVKMDYLQSAEENYGKLLNYKAALEQEQKLTTGLALECDMAMGGDNLARLCFCDESRQKKYELALEAVNLGLASLMAAMAAAIVAVIVAAIRMLRADGAGSNGEVDPVAPASIAAQKEAMGQSLVELNQLPPEAKAELDDVLQQAKTGKVKRKKRATKATSAEDKTKPGIATERDQTEIPDHVGFVAPLSAFQMDHLSSGEYTQLMDQFLQTIDQSHPVGVLQDGNNAYRELVQASKNEQPVTDDHVSALKEHYIHLMANPRRLHAVILEQMKKLENKQRLLDSGHVQFPENLNHALKTFTTAITSPAVTSYAQNRVEMSKELERMRQQAQAAQQIFTEEKNKEKAGEKGVHGDVVTHGREVMKELHGLLAVMLKADLTFKKYWKSLDGCAKYLAWVVTTARWNHSLTLHDKGMDRQAIANDGSIKRMDAIAHALENFRKRAR